MSGGRGSAIGCGRGDENEIAEGGDCERGRGGELGVGMAIRNMMKGIVERPC